MDGDSYLFRLFLLFFLILLNAFFAAAEAALLSIKPASVRRLAEEAGARGKRLADLTENSGRFLATIQVGVTLAGFLASAFAADSFAGPVTSWVQGWLGDGVYPALLHGAVVVFITLILSFVTLVFGELVPKQLGLRYTETIALRAARPVNFLAEIAAPFVFTLEAAVNGILKSFGVKPGDRNEVTEEEIRILVDMGEENGAIESDERQMIENVFEFNNTPAEEVMTHRTEIVALDIHSPPEEVERVLMECGFSRVPVYRDSIDQIVGFLHFRDYFTAKLLGHAKPELASLLKPVYLAPASMRANILFRNMRSKKYGMAVILDEYGGTSGLVSVEDLLEEIVGSLYDEFDDPGEELEPLGENTWRVDGSLRLADLSERTGVELPDGEYDTIGGLIFGILNAVPTAGDEVELPEFHVKLVAEAVGDRRTEKVLMKYLPSKKDDEEETGE